jgi:hypothetical protein
MEIDIASDGAGIQVTARGSQGQHSPPHTLAPSDTVRQFGEWVKAAAAQAEALEQTVPKAQELYEALFREGLRDVLVQLKDEHKKTEPLLMRLMIQGLELHAFPWEALCEPRTQLGFLGISKKLHLARGVHSTRPWLPREVKGAVRLLVISPSDEAAPARLRASLHKSIESGEIEWLEPLTGRSAVRAAVFRRLRGAPVPHILHFIGHGGLDDSGAPTLRMADTADGEASWCKVELLATELVDAFQDSLRLVVLEACEGAQPGRLASAAEWLVKAGADAVVAHLWPVKADVARLCSGTFYASLTGAEAQRGDVARSLHDARREVLAEHPNSGEAFSPVLYLHGHDTHLFDFRYRKPRPPPALGQAAPRVSPAAPTVRPLLELLQRPFSLLLGDHWSTFQEDFYQSLRQKLQGTPWAAPDSLPLSALAQRYAMQFTDEYLSAQFQAVFRDARPSLPLVEALARRLAPGLHINLMRVPVLENELSEHPPELPLYVVQPSLNVNVPPFILHHEAGEGWRQVDTLPERFDPARAVVLVRLYRGFLPEGKFGNFHTPLLTEDDYLQGVQDLESVLPPELADHLIGTLVSRPALLLGMSLSTWDHRMLLRRLFGHQTLPRRSTVLLEPDSVESDAWQEGRGLPVGTKLQVVQAPSAELAALISESSPGARR